MRLKLSMLLVVMAMFALICGILFMTPVFIAGLFCTFTMILTPAIWLTGAIYARGIWQSFFIGGTLTGFMPHVITVWYGLMVVFSTATNVFDKGLDIGIPPEEMLNARLMLAGFWAMPGIFAMLGGGVSMLTFRVVRGQNDPVSHPSDILAQQPDQE